MQPTYNIDESYDWNYDNGPVFTETPDVVELKRILEKETSNEAFLGFSVRSRLGVPAGLLLNANWCRLYSELGFDLITYKTVRSCFRKSHPNPNVAFLDVHRQLELGKDEVLFGKDTKPDLKDISITNSFGIPSKEVSEWMDDVRKAKSYLKEGQLLIVSVAGTPKEGGSIQDLADDFAHCAKRAVEAGADVIETNFSCPNVTSSEGSIYMDDESSKIIAQTVKKAIGDVPYMIKIGPYESKEQTKAFFKAVMPYAQAIQGINTIPKHVTKRDGSDLLPGRVVSGVCGSAILKQAMNTIKLLLEVKKELNSTMAIVWCGGIMTEGDAKTILKMDLQGVMSCTGAMFNPLLALKTKLHTIK